MGLEARVTFESDLPGWPDVRAVLTEQGCPVQVRMIDGELAFPDEEPPAAWRELRLAIAGNMVTLRRQPGAIGFVVWGNADAAMLAARATLMQAFARAGGGHIETDSP